MKVRGSWIGITKREVVKNAEFSHAPILVPDKNTRTIPLLIVQALDGMVLLTSSSFMAGVMQPWKFLEIMVLGVFSESWKIKR